MQRCTVASCTVPCLAALPRQPHLRASGAHWCRPRVPCTMASAGKASKGASRAPQGGDKQKQLSLDKALEVEAVEKHGLLLQRRIGSGAFSVVYEASWLDPQHAHAAEGRKYAAKCLYKDQDLHRIEEELRFLRMLKCVCSGAAHQCCWALKHARARRCAGGRLTPGAPFSKLCWTAAHTPSFSCGTLPTWCSKMCVECGCRSC